MNYKDSVQMLKSEKEEQFYEYILSLNKKFIEKKSQENSYDFKADRPLEGAGRELKWSKLNGTWFGEKRREERSRSHTPPTKRVSEVKKSSNFAVNKNFHQGLRDKLRPLVTSLNLSIVSKNN